MRQQHLYRFGVALAAFATVTGCAVPEQRVGCAAGLYSANQLFPRSPRVDCTFGDAVNVAVARQVMDKEAAIKNANKDAAGMDGVAAKESLDRYLKSFRTPDPAPNVFSIGVSGQSGAK
jgi:hypothetical protein